MAYSSLFYQRENDDMSMFSWCFIITSASIPHIPIYQN